MWKIIFILVIWFVVILFMIKQYRDDKIYVNKPKWLIYFTWSIMFLIGCGGSYFIAVN